MVFRTIRICSVRRFFRSLQPLKEEKLLTTEVYAPDFPRGGPFDPHDPEAYLRWREAKLAGRPDRVEDLLVEIAAPGWPSDAEHKAILERCRGANMAVYACRDTGEALAPGELKARLAELGVAFGLRRLDSNLCADEDGITALEVREDGAAGEYIPYSNRPLSWHTDGYYNSAAKQVRGLILHCGRPAASGGANALMDPEIAYIRLRDENPEYIAALMHPAALTIPPNTTGGEEIRPARVGPVFSVDPRGGALHMRYSARKIHVVWRDDPATKAAVEFLTALLAADSPDILHWRLGAGQGYIGNNVLHNRSTFEDGDGDGEGRLLYRARYFDRMAATEPSHD
jgi:hypothetical protein